MVPRSSGSQSDASPSYQGFLPGEEKRVVTTINRLINHNFPVRCKDVVLEVINAIRQEERETRGSEEPRNLPLSAKYSILKHNKRLDDALTTARKSYGLKVPLADLQMEIARQLKFLRVYEQAKISKDVTPDKIYAAEEYGFVMRMTSNNQNLTIKRRDSKFSMRSQSPPCAFAILCVSQRGKFLDPYVVERNLTHAPPNNDMNNDISGVRVAYSTTGLPDLPHTMEWMKLFDKSTDPNDNTWRILVVDGYRFNLTPELEIFCRARHIVLLSFPKKTSQTINPFHRGILQIFEDQYDAFMRQRWETAESRALKIDRKELVPQIMKFQKTCRDQNHKILNAWRQSFLFPVSPEALRKELETLDAGGPSRGDSKVTNVASEDDMESDSSARSILLTSDNSRTASMESSIQGQTTIPPVNIDTPCDGPQSQYSEAKSQDRPRLRPWWHQRSRAATPEGVGKTAVSEQTPTIFDGDHLTAPLEEPINTTPRAKFRQKLDLLVKLPPDQRMRVRDELACDYATLVGKCEALEDQLSKKRTRSER